MITFEYNGKIYKPSNLENKLKKLGVTLNDVKILDDTETKAEKEYRERKEQHQQSAINDNKRYKVYFDSNKCGWFLFDKLFPYNESTLKDIQEKIDKNEYIYVDESSQLNLGNLIKEKFYQLMKKRNI